MCFAFCACGKLASKVVEDHARSKHDDLCRCISDHRTRSFCIRYILGSEISQTGPLCLGLGRVLLNRIAAGHTSLNENVDVVKALIKSLFYRWNAHFCLQETELIGFKIFTSRLLYILLNRFGQMFGLNFFFTKLGTASWQSWRWLPDDSRFIAEYMNAYTCLFKHM